MKLPTFKRYLTLLSGLLLTGSMTVAAGAAPWHEAACARRVALRLPTVPGDPVTAGIVLTGRELYRWTGFPCPEISSLRVCGPDGAVNLQAMEFDGGTDLLPQGNGRLDDNDRLLFAVRLERKPVTLYLYYDGPAAAAAAVAVAVPAAEVQEKTKGLVPLILKSGDLTIGLRGGGKPPFDN